MRITLKTVNELPEETTEQLKSKESKLTILALRAFPSSPIQREIQAKRAAIRAKLEGCPQ
jgi:hypothetical protein